MVGGWHVSEENMDENSILKYMYMTLTKWRVQVQGVHTGKWYLLGTVHKRYLWVHKRYSDEIVLQSTWKLLYNLIRLFYISYF